jgi:hypothetical protein
MKQIARAHPSTQSGRARRAVIAGGFSLSLSVAGYAHGTECKDDPKVVGQCFGVHGHLHGTASLRVELAPVGRDPLRGRIFEVHYPYDSLQRRPNVPWMPAELLSIVQTDGFFGPNYIDVYGDFEVCRLEADVPGVMRHVCIQSAKNLVIRRTPQ